MQKLIYSFYFVYMILCMDKCRFAPVADILRMSQFLTSFDQQVFLSKSYHLDWSHYFIEYRDSLLSFPKET